LSDKKTFTDLGLSETTIKALTKKGFEEPTPIQEKCIPFLLEDKFDVIGQAQTGTGKTAAFGLPILEILNSRSKKVQAIILTPTRELAIQVSEELYSLKGERRIQIAAIYGGQSIEQQIRKLRKGVQIVVGTPGRVIDLINRKELFIDEISFFILDEADEMLNMGFVDDIEKIMKSAPDVKRTLFFSATIPDRILHLAQNYMKDYKIIKVKSKQLTTTQTDQIYFEVRPNDKFDALTRIIDVEPEFYGLIFCRTKVEVDRVSHHLIERGYDAGGLHGDISQARREQILGKFKQQKITILVATDVASRGIDINNLTHVINYDLPQDPDSYVHRIGRTGRAGKKGVAITFVTAREYRQMLYIGRMTKTKIRKESLPGGKEVLNIKKTKLKHIIDDMIEMGISNKNIKDFTNDLLSQYPPEEVIQSLLQLAYKDQFEEREYKELRENTVDSAGSTRLFIAKGKKDGMNPKQIIALIQKQTNTKSSQIQNIRIFDNFSFISVPFTEAEIIIETFKKIKKGSRPIVVKAKPRKK